MQSFSPSQDSSKSEWIEIRDSRGGILFKYNPYTNQIEFRRGSMVYDLIKLDEIRARLGIIPANPPAGADIVTVSTIDK